MMLQMVGVTIATGTTLALLVRIHPLVIAVLLVVSVPNLIMRSHYASKMFNLWALRTPSQRMVGYLTGLLVARDAIKEVRLFALQTSFLTRFRDHWQTMLGEVRDILFAQERLNILLSALSMIGAGAIWAYAIIQTVLGRLSIGDSGVGFSSCREGARRYGRTL